MKDLGIEDKIVENWSQRQGMILVTGPTGSGKSTLLAAGSRLLIEREQGCGKMLTYEAPIEYVYDAIVGPRSLVAQSEIPGIYLHLLRVCATLCGANLTSFSLGSP